MNNETSKEILEARKKMAEKFGDTKLGGKGKSIIFNNNINNHNNIY